jgi:hypothetical protein
VNSLSRIPPSLAELPLRRKTHLLLGLYEFLLRAKKSNQVTLIWGDFVCNFAKHPVLFEYSSRGRVPSG